MFHDFLEIFKHFAQVYTWLFVLNWILSTIIIFFERKKPVSTLLWVMAINFLPILGFILYLFIGQDISKSKIFEGKTTADREIQADFRRQLKQIQRGELQYSNDRTKEYEEILKMFNQAEGEILYSGNDVKIYNNGSEKFRDLFFDLKNARHSIFVQYYIFKSDELSQEFIRILKEKAQENIQVYLLVDGMGARKFHLRDRRALEDAGVKIAIFFPGVFPKINTHMNYRNHRKIVVIDYDIGYVGGLNVGDEYIGKDKRFGFWRDTHLRITGDAVNGLAWRFYLDFNFASNGKIDRFRTELAKVTGNKDISIVTSGPDTKADSIRNGYEKLITRARKEIYIQTPYFVPDDGLLKSLKVAALSGVDVNIMIPQKRDHPFVHWASLSFLGELLEWGVKAYLYEGGFLHSKVVLSDDYLSSVGTANFDIRSFELNFEVNAFMFDEEINRKLKQDFYRDMEDSTQITKEMYDRRSAWVKIRESVSRLLSPLL